MALECGSHRGEACGAADRVLDTQAGAVFCRARIRAGLWDFIPN